jgi:septum site-determining protein MinC
MVAVLSRSLAPPQPHHLILPDSRGSNNALQEVRHALGGQLPRGTLCLVAGDWLLRIPELREVQAALAAVHLTLVRVISREPCTLVAAAAMGIRTEAEPEPEPPDQQRDGGQAGVAAIGEALTIHRGTLRSGDHLETKGTVLLLGDVNPGARISAGAHVLVLGRLRGVAHAGCHGDTQARILALQLRPLQLRIAGVVARGPGEQPPPGLAEEARLVRGTIQIDPASSAWPLPS